MAVERISERTETHPLGVIRIHRYYRDDLENIARVMAEFGTLTIEVNEELTGSEPEDFAEMRTEFDLPERLNRVRMVASQGESKVLVELGPGSRIGLIEPNIAAHGALTRIKEICANCRARRWWVFGLLFAFACSVAALVTIYTADEGPPQGSVVLLAGALLGAALVTGAVSMTGYIAEVKRGAKMRDLILNVPRSERPTFGQRLIADGGVSLFWGGIGLVGGGVVSWVVNQLPGL